LGHYRVQRQTLDWIKTFLRGWIQQVVVDGERSSAAIVTSGVPQGTVLRPLLYLGYINNLPSKVKSITRLFADDCQLYRSVKSEEDTNTIQSDLDNYKSGRGIG
jgi:hypothetical protein